jgi:hypothetical protein
MLSQVKRREHSIILVELPKAYNAFTYLAVLLIAGIPLNELVGRYAPFLMSDEAEIIQAIEDYRNRRMRKIDF